MAKIRLQYDLADGPYFLADGASSIPSNSTPDAKVLNIGLTAYPVLSTTSGNLVNVRGRFSQTSGDARNIYNRLYLYGSTGGESLRSFTSVMANLDTAHGAHISLNFDATAGGSECSGLGAALRATLHIPNIASWAPTGTLTGAQIEIYSDGSASDPAGLTELSFLRICNSGDATGAADVDDDAFFMSLQGFTAGAAKMFATGLNAGTVNAACTAALKCKVGSTTYYIPLATAIS